jgi:hypothetical protein
MASGLFNRHARDERPANDQAADATVADERAAAQEQQADADRARADDAPTRAQRAVATEQAAAEERAAEQNRTIADADRQRAGVTGRAGRVFGRSRHPLATDQPVPPGGAVAPLPERTDGKPTVRDRVETAEQEREEAQREADAARRQVRRMHTSFAATLSLIIGVCAVLAALSGRLAPVAVAAGVLGLLFAAAGLAAVSRRTVTGHHVALFGLVFSIAGVVLGVLAINKTASWLNVDVDQASRLRDWLNSEWSWLKRW